LSPVMGGARRRQWPINWCRTTAPSARPSASTHDCAHPIHHPPRPPTPIPDSSGPSFVPLASHKTAVDVYCSYVVSSRLFGPGKLRCVLQSYIGYSCTRVQYIGTIPWPRTLVRSSLMGHRYVFAHVLWVEARTTPRTVPSPTVAVTAAEKAGSTPAGTIHGSVEQ